MNKINLNFDKKLTNTKTSRKIAVEITLEKGKITLIDEDNNKKVIKQGDMYLYQMDINVGDNVVIVDNKLKKA